MLSTIRLALLSVLFCVMCLLVLTHNAQAQGDSTSPPSAEELEARREQARIDRLWKMSWREYAPRYIQHGQQYVYVPGYSPRYPSSAGKTLSQYQQASAWQQKYTDVIGRDKTRKLTKPAGDAFAAVATLPKVTPGAYGYIHSGNIEKIVDRKTLVLEDIWLVDEGAAREEKDTLLFNALEEVDADIKKHMNDKRDKKRNWKDAINRREAERKAVNWMFEDRAEAVTRQRGRSFSQYEWELVGYRTASLTEDARWPSGKAAEKGLQVIIVSVDDRKVTAVPASSLGKGLTEEQFVAMLKTRELTKEEFVGIVTDTKRQVTNRDEVTKRVLATLEGIAPEVAQDKPRENVNDTVELVE